MFQISETCQKTYATAHAGLLVMRGVSNPPQHAELDQQKADLENQLRTNFAGLERSAIAALPTIQAYDAYYKRFNKTYHVQLQLESIVFKGKPIPHVAALVEAMFMAEVKNLLLTAGHDLDTLQLPLTLDVASGEERYTLMRGQEQTLKNGDMLIKDGTGILSSIIYGPDQRTQINPATQNVIFTVYAPQGIAKETVLAHLQDIQGYARLISPTAQTELLQVFGAGKE